MKFLVRTSQRRYDLEANHGAHARALAEAKLEAGERIEKIMLYAQRMVDPSPVMPPDHARNVARGGCA